MIQNDARNFGVSVVRNSEKATAKKHGITTFPALVYFRNQQPATFDGNQNFVRISLYSPWIVVTFFFLLYKMDIYFLVFIDYPRTRLPPPTPTFQVRKVIRRINKSKCKWADHGSLSKLRSMFFFFNIL